VIKLMVPWHVSSCSGEVGWKLLYSIYLHYSGYLLVSGFTVNFWIHALVIKLVPCVLMSLFGFLLVLTVRRQRRRSERLLGSTSKKSGSSQASAKSQQSKSKAREGRHDDDRLSDVSQESTV